MRHLSANPVYSRALVAAIAGFLFISTALNFILSSTGSRIVAEAPAADIKKDTSVISPIPPSKYSPTTPPVALSKSNQNNVYSKPVPLSTKPWEISRETVQPSSPSQSVSLDKAATTPVFPWETSRESYQPSPPRQSDSPIGKPAYKSVSPVAVTSVNLQAPLVPLAAASAVQIQSSTSLLATGDQAQEHKDNLVFDFDQASSSIATDRMMGSPAFVAPAHKPSSVRICVGKTLHCLD